jgi:hypothetical protein
VCACVLVRKRSDVREHKSVSTVTREKKVESSAIEFLC